MHSQWRTVALAIALSLLLTAGLLWGIFRFILPAETVPDEGFDPQYVIKEWEGKVAVFEGKDTYPMTVYDVFVQTLPEEERQKVTVGIPVEDADRLWLLLEDYTG